MTNQANPIERVTIDLRASGYPTRDDFHSDPEAWAWLKEVLSSANIDPGESLFWICYQADGWREIVPQSKDILERITKAADRVWSVRVETVRFLGRALGRAGRLPTQKLRKRAESVRCDLGQWAELPGLIRAFMPAGVTCGLATLQKIQEKFNTEPFMPLGLRIPSQQSPETAHCKEVQL